MKFKLSIIAPVYNEETNIIPFVDEIERFCGIYNYELILVNDGSFDNSVETIRNVMKYNEKLRLISFARNFGHQNAIKAGLDHALGDAIIMLDADLQHPPSLIPEMISLWQHGCKVVQGVRKYKDQSKFKVFTSNTFYKLINSISDISLMSGSADFRLLDRLVVEQLKTNKEFHLFLRGLISWYGYETKLISFIANERFSGESKFSLTKMINLSISGITGFSIKPLRLSIFIGFIVSSFSVGYLVYAIFVRLFTDDAITGWASLMFVITLIGGIQLILLGIIGEYVGKIFQQLKNRPLYLVDFKLGFDEE